MTPTGEIFREEPDKRRRVKRSLKKKRTSDGKKQPGWRRGVCGSKKKKPGEMHESLRTLKGHPKKT